MRGGIRCCWIFIISICEFELGEWVSGVGSIAFAVGLGIEADGRMIGVRAAL